jgi:hypothetical protein
MDTDERIRIVRAGALATLGVALVGVGEFSLHFSPAGYAGADEFRYLLHVPRWRLDLGHFLGVLAAPVYALGYWHVAGALRPAPRGARAAVFGLGVYTFMIAGVWLGSRAQLALLVQAQATGAAPAEFAALVDAYRRYSEALIQLVRVGVLALSLALAAAILRGRTGYPRWFALVSPILLLALVFALHLAAPAVGGYLVPTAMNVAHLVFFGLSTAVYARRSRPRPERPRP